MDCLLAWKKFSFFGWLHSKLAAPISLGIQRHPQIWLYILAGEPRGGSVHAAALSTPLGVFIGIVTCFIQSKRRRPKCWRFTHLRFLKRCRVQIPWKSIVISILKRKKSAFIFFTVSMSENFHLKYRKHFDRIINSLKIKNPKADFLKALEKNEKEGISGISKVYARIYGLKIPSASLLTSINKKIFNKVPDSKFHRSTLLMIFGAFVVFWSFLWYLKRKKNR